MITMFFFTLIFWAFNLKIQRLMENFNFSIEPLLLDEFPLKRITNPILQVNKF